MGESGQLVARSLPLDLTAERVHTGRAQPLQQEPAQPLTHWWPGEGRCALRSPVGFLAHEPPGPQRQGHVVMPAVPGAPLLRRHAHCALAPCAARCKAGARCDDPRQGRQRRPGQRPLGHARRTALGMLAVAGLRIGGSASGSRSPRAGVRERLPGDDQAFRGAGALALQPRRPAVPAPRALSRPLLPIAPRPGRPRLHVEALAPLGPRVPRGLGPTSTSWRRGRGRLEVPERGGAGHAQPRALTALA
jgi:hypothetical protein